MWLLWKKSSQVKTNNKKKDDLLQEINRLLFRIDKGKYAENLDTDHINKVGEKNKAICHESRIYNIHL